MNVQRYSDDGEPQGTGGIPILEVLKKNDVRNVCVVVTRYFGGILLGAGGLTRAYVKGASDAVKASGIVERVPGYEVNLQIEYDLLGKVQYYLREQQIETEEIEYTSEVTLKIYLEETALPILKNDIVNLTSSQAKISVSDASLYYKMEHRLYKEFEEE